MDTFDNKILKNDKSGERNYEQIEPTNDVVTMKIPCNLGVTGHVYRSEEIYVCQCAIKD